MILNHLILGSTSVYRAQVLSRSGFTFKQIKPDFDEDQLKDAMINDHFSPREIAEKLSLEKGLSLASKYPDSIIISGDQLVDVDGKIFGKPGHFENALKQLNKMNGRTHHLITCTTLIAGEKKFQNTNVTTLRMKNLTNSEIKAYLDLDQPYDCAGSIKIEKHGLSLFESIECTDFSAIEGLPLIWITNTLKGLGYELFKK